MRLVFKRAYQHTKLSEKDRGRLSGALPDEVDDEAADEDQASDGDGYGG